MTSHIQSPSHDPLLGALVTQTLQPNNHELLRHLGQVLGLQANDEVLLIADSTDGADAVLQDELGCRVEVYQGDIHQLPFESNRFASAIVAVPILKDVHGVARELSRVLKANGCLGMVVFSVYRDQMPDATFQSVTPLMGGSRPAAAYRAVLAESGFTAFVSEDRRRDLRRTALASYREHMLRSTPESSVRTGDAETQALGLLAAGSIGVTLITAEKGL